MNEYKNIDFDAPHVVFKGTDGKIAFAEKASNYHEGCEIIDTFRNFDAAAKFCKDYTEKGVVAHQADDISQKESK